MIRFTAVFAVLASSAWGAVPPELKAKLFARYDQKNLSILQSRFLLTRLFGTGQGLSGDFTMHYDHIHPAMGRDTWPGRYSQRNLLDEYTTEYVDPGATSRARLVPGEMLRMRKFYVEETNQLCSAGRGDAVVPGGAGLPWVQFQQYWILHGCSKDGTGAGSRAVPESLWAGEHNVSRSA